ncbi:hypothetical protein SBA4_2340015 [Candidatus Sulfopaludibacter sp. SbA4]|nr:hypothetical protein SBA4_2340015 [Candidatus Sulfopaludibacter sp. SbA4]
MAPLPGLAAFKQAWRKSFHESEDPPQNGYLPLLGRPCVLAFPPQNGYLPLLGRPCVLALV